MLQTRLETEHFNSLPNLLSSERSRSGFVTTDRPDSSQLVDLHVYIIPKKVWKDVQHLAENEAMDDAISAGFVHVSPHMKLCDLREAIDQSCGAESYFPRDFIFLRSVGRCLTRVKPRQENELKVKNYRPPQTFAPEIYLLEGRHEDYVHIPSASPPLSSASYIFGNRNRARSHYDYDSDDQRRASSKLFPNLNRKPMRAAKPYAPPVNPNNSFSRLPSSERQSRTRFPQIGSDHDESMTRESSKLKEEQERLRRRQAELERMRRAAEERKVLSERDENERRRLEQEKIEMLRRRLEYEKAEAERRRLKEEEAATRIQASYRGFKDRQAFKERKRRLLNAKRLDPITEVEKETETSIKSRSPNQTLRQIPVLAAIPVESKHAAQKPPSPKPLPSDDNENEQEDIQNEISRILTRSSSIGSTSYADSSSTSQVQEPTSRLTPEHSEIVKSVPSPEIPTKVQEKPLSRASRRSKLPKPLVLDLRINSTKKEKVLPTNEFTSRTFTNKKAREPSPISLPRATPEYHSENETNMDEIELERREAEARRRRQLEEEEQKRKARELEEQRRKEMAKRQREDPETLRARLQELRARRADLEKIREEIIKHLKNIHNRITLRRKEARDMWKKRYFSEKKKTPPLEERIMSLKNELEQVHRRTIQTIDNEAKHAAQAGLVKEADTGTFIAKLTHTHHDIQGIRHQIEQAKLRLTTDVKLRNQAENECRSLRHELNQAKMNLNHIKSRI